MRVLPYQIHFIAADVRHLLERQKVQHLPSPPLTPRYNPSQEAAIGSPARVKTRALHIAAAAGRFGCWSCDDVEAARLEANSLLSTSGETRTRCPMSYGNHDEPSPPPNAPPSAAPAPVAARAEEKKLMQSIKSPPGVCPAVQLKQAQRAMVARRAIRRALLDLGYLFPPEDAALVHLKIPLFEQRLGDPHASWPEP